MATSAPAARAPTANPVVPRARPYKDFLTPALHRCFTNAALAALVACWVEATLMARFSFFWSWFPIGINGLRTALLFVSCLSMFLLRLTNLHIGLRTSDSGFQSLSSILLGTKAIQTIVWYYVSAFVFSEVYIFSTSEYAGLSWIDMGKSYERPRLNERAIVFRFLFTLLAVCQSVSHLYFDFDAMVIPARSRTNTSSKHYSSLQQMQNALPRLGLLVAAQMIAISVAGPVLYFALFRDAAWEVAHSVARTIYTIQKSADRPGLQEPTALFGRFVWSGSLLAVLWQVTNLAFTVYGSREPLKKAVPITNDAKDPNGSLANGLKSKKFLPHSIALWELQIIADRFPDRRRTIYNDFERPTSTSWTDIVTVCISELERISQSVTTAQTATVPQSPPTTQPSSLPPKQHIAKPLRQDQAIYSPAARPKSALDALAEGVGSVAKNIGQSPGSSPLGTKTRGLIASSAANNSSNNPQSPVSNLMKRVQAYAITLLRTPAGYPFRHTFRRRVKAVVLGQPYSKAADIHNAAQAISKLTVRSLQEDNFGQVQKDIPRIMRTFVTAIQKIQSLMATMAPHWTDVYFDGRRSVPEVDDLLVTLKGGLEDIIITFGEYIDALGISRAELKVAKEAVGKGKEMAQR